MKTSPIIMATPTSIQLDNDQISLSLTLPGTAGTYCGTRFSWAGIISAVTVKGHRIFGPWQGEGLPLDTHDNVTGTAGEFGMGTADMPPPLGFNDAKPGELFLKIGVGTLRRPDTEPYGFSADYELVETAPWDIKTGKQHIAMRQKISLNGYGYDYTHTIALDPSQAAFVTRHTLTNTGTNPIDQTHYSHNFIVFNNQPIGPDYTVEFPFSPEHTLNNTCPAKLDGRTLTFSETLKHAVFTMFGGFKGAVEDNQVTVHHRESGLTLTIKGDTPIVRYHFFAAPGALCPEPFVSLHLQPGETTTWQHRYSLT